MFKDKKMENPVQAVGIVQKCFQDRGRSSRRAKGSNIFFPVKEYILRFKVTVAVDGLQNPVETVVKRSLFYGGHFCFEINGIPIGKVVSDKKYIPLEPPYKKGNRVVVVYDAANPNKCRIEEDELKEKQENELINAHKEGGGLTKKFIRKPDKRK